MRIQHRIGQYPHESCWRLLYQRTLQSSLLLFSAVINEVITGSVCTSCVCKDLFFGLVYKAFKVIPVSFSRAKKRCHVIETPVFGSLSRRSTRFLSVPCTLAVKGTRCLSPARRSRCDDKCSKLWQN